MFIGEKNLSDLYQAVFKGKCSADVASRTPGKVADSRWLTTACRAQRVYVSSKNASDILIYVVNYIVKVYIPQ